MRITNLNGYAATVAPVPGTAGAKVLILDALDGTEQLRYAMDGELCGKIAKALVTPAIELAAELPNGGRKH